MSALNGVPNLATGRIVTSVGAVANFKRAMGFDAAGALVTVNGAGAVPRNFNGSVNVTNSGQVCIDTVGAIASYVSGLPMTAVGDLCVASSAPNSFSQGVGLFNGRVAIS